MHLFVCAEEYSGGLQKVARVCVLALNQLLHDPAHKVMTELLSNNDAVSHSVRREI